MRGPNYWSKTQSNIIVLKIDLEALERAPTHQIDGFLPRLKAMLPGLQSHKCSHGNEGGFLEVVAQGTWMAHVIEHIAIELQNLAGMPVKYGKTHSTNTQGVYNVIVGYQVEDAGRYAVESAIDIAEALVKSEAYDIQRDVDKIMRIAKKNVFGPSTRCIVEEAVSRGVPFKRLNGNSLLVLGYGNKQKKLRATVAGTTTSLGVEIAGDKEETKNVLDAAHIPVPQGAVIFHEDDLQYAIKKTGFPLVVKPATGNHGRGITANINSIEEAVVAFQAAKAVSNAVIVEQFIEGFDYRLIVVNYKFVAAAMRTPASVTGDGASTILQLIEKVNADELRGEGHDNIMTKITLDDSSMKILGKKGLTLDTVLPKGEEILLKDTANMSTGGTAEDVTDKVHPYNIFMAERIAALVGLDICGIDILAKDIGQKLTGGNGAIVEVNAGPGLRMHLEPAKGLSRNIAKPIVDMLFPNGDNGRIPIIAVTGTNGKTTTARLISHIAQKAGHNVGFTATEGIYIGGHQVLQGDCTGPASSEAVLFDPTVDFAVLECARGGMIRSGLAFEESDISIVTNVSADHLGLKDINTLEDMARVKAVVPRTTKREGYAILNADDDLVYDMHKELHCNIALFSMDAGNERVLQHCAKGGLAAIIEDGYLTVVEGKWKTRIERIEEIPLTLNGRADSMIKNLMPAALVATLRGFDLKTVKEALRTFIPSAAQTPGRMNVFKFRDFTLMLDYAHNSDGLLQLKKFLDKTPASVKVGIIGMAGDRRDEDFREVGAIAAQMFDEIIIRHDKDLRGRPKEEFTELMSEGIHSVNPNMKITEISDEIEAVQYAIDNAKKDSFITVTSEKIVETIAYIEEQVKNEKQNHSPAVKKAAVKTKQALKTK
jgi:cyanophycin synthetase